MGEKRRHDDPEEEDHSEDRGLDWRVVAPRWMLVLVLILSVGLNGMMGNVVYKMINQRLEQVEKANADPRWDLVARLAAIQSEHTEKLRQQEVMLRDVYSVNVKVTEVQAELRALNLRLTRKGF